MDLAADFQRIFHPMPKRRRGINIPYPNEKAPILWDIAGVIILIAIIKTLIEFLLE